ncbi:acyltransferase family protein, partial [Cetobacterium sp.]|uniref:acyltransferase family protein n=1 Tax=Cetobacterium sp. TaxID=2071632 RepID=UPI003F2FACDB
MENNLSKKDVQILKGVGILLMVTLHLFGFPSWLKNGSIYIELTEKFNLEYTIAKFGGICVALYLFLSGYGMEKITNKQVTFKECFIKSINLYKIYWIVFIPFTIIGYFYFDLKIEIKELVLNIFAIKPSFNVFVWFIRLYIQLLLIFPLLKKILDSSYKKSLFFSGGIYFCTIFNSGFFYIFKSLRPFRETFMYE